MFKGASVVVVVGDKVVVGGRVVVVDDVTGTIVGAVTFLTSGADRPLNKTYAIPPIRSTTIPMTKSLDASGVKGPR